MLASFTTLGYLNLRHIPQTGNVVRVETEIGTFDIPRSKFMLASMAGASSLASLTVQAVIFPAMMTDAWQVS